MKVASVSIAIRTFLSQKAGLLRNRITVLPHYVRYNGHATLGDELNRDGLYRVCRAGP